MLPLHHQSQDCRLTQVARGALVCVALSSRAVRVLVTLVALHICAPPCILHAQLHMHRLMAVHKLVAVLYTLYLCIWLCIWCVSASKTETHRYTRIRTPHPVYLTSRALACRIRLENESLTIIFFAGLRPAPLGQLEMFTESAT